MEQVKEHLRVESDPKLRSALEEQQTALAAQLNRNRFMQGSVQVQVDAVRQQISTEQASLSDIQRRLDDLER